jgi:hypothetical protein
VVGPVWQHAIGAKIGDGGADCWAPAIVPGGGV